jgi:TolB-like protein/Tfp pilus assembly protein PilF
MSERRLAAIMFSDIVGYTSLMRKDEKKAFEFLRNNRRIQHRLIKKYRGKWLKEMGDGILASFPSTTDAVLCASSIQLAASEFSIPLRIGIHLGEVIFEKKDVLGDGVNIASRIQGVSGEGEIAISGTVNNDLKNKEGIYTEFIGKKDLKGIDEQVEVYKILRIDENLFEYKIDTGELLKSTGKKSYLAIAVIIVLISAALVIWKFYPETTEAILENSIAVIPFDYYGEDPNKAYLANGTWDQLLNQLFKIQDLHVTSKQSMEQYRNSEKTAQEIAREQQVNYVLEGSFSLVGDRLRLIVQLIRAEDDRHVWSEDFEREWKDIFAIQKELSMAIATECKAEISSSEAEILESSQTDDIVAYEYYLKGRDFQHEWLFNRTAADLDSAVQYFRRALDRDTTYALAYTGLAELHHLEGARHGDPYNGFNDSVWVLIHKALLYDKNCAAAYDLRAWYYWLHKYDSELILNDLDKVISIRPNDPDNYWTYELYGTMYAYKLHDNVNRLFYYHKALQCASRASDDRRQVHFLKSLGFGYGTLGFRDKQRSYYEEALKIGKDTISYFDELATMEFSQIGNFDSALNLYEKIYASDSNKIYYLYNMGMTNLFLRNFEDAYQYFLESFELYGESPTSDIPFIERIGYVFLKVGNEDEGIRYLNEGIERYNKRLGWKFNYIYLASCYSALGEKEKALESLVEFNNAEFPRLDRINYLKWNPLFDNIREEPRFKEILVSMEEKNRKERDRVQAWIEEEGMF